MAEDGVPEIFQAEPPGIRGVYAYVSGVMHDDIKAKPQRRRENALDKRSMMAPDSSLPILDESLTSKRKNCKEVISLKST